MPYRWRDGGFTALFGVFSAYSFQPSDSHMYMYILNDHHVILRLARLYSLLYSVQCRKQYMPLRILLG